MPKESLNRAQRRRQQRQAQEHVPTFWDSMFNRIWVVGLCAAFVAVVVYSAFFNRSSASSKPDKPATPPPATQPAQPAATNTPAPPAEPAKPKTDARIKTTDEKVGTGEAVKVGDNVTVNYRGTLANGTEFDNSYKKGRPLTFTVGSGMIEGFAQGVVGMKPGGKRKVVVPPELGYGAQDKGTIPPNSTLTFEIELVSINSK